MNNATAATILVVDDNAATRYSTSRVLRSANFEVLEACSGQEALALVDANVSVVVLDINLPDIDGYEVCRRLRDNPATKRLSIVHLSASFVDDSDKAFGLEAGADGYLTHPVEPIVLAATVKAFARTQKVEGDLRRSEAKFKAVFDRAPSGIALLDERLQFVKTNAALEQLVRCDEGLLIGHPLTRVLAGEAHPQIADIVAALERDGDWHGFLPGVCCDSAQIDMEWRISRHFEPGLHLAMVTDNTERKRTEAEKERLLASEQAARADAEKANRLKDEFLATLSHELRNPISSIFGWAELLRRKHGHTPDLVEGLLAIERGAKIQTQLISDLLDVSSIVSGKLRLEVEMVDCRSVIKAAVEIVEAAAHAKQISIEQDLGQNLNWISADPSRLQQIIWNLLTNAIKFTPKNGSIQIKVERSHSNMSICVRDNGQGIDPEFLPFVFERFRQGDASTRKSAAGLGLGLSIVRHLVEMHGGTINAESGGIGQGARFTVKLPLTALTSDGKHGVPAGARGSITLDGSRVLVVEDDTGSRALVARLLRDAGAVVADVEDVATAIAMLEDFRPSVLVSDIGMTPQDGFDLIRHIRSRGYDPHRLPAIALTAFARKEDRRDVLVAGYQMHLTKPIDSQELLTAVAAFSFIRD